MVKILHIECDTNDADYISSFHEVTERELEILEPIIKIIKENASGRNETDRWKNYWWDNSEYADKHLTPEIYYKDKLTPEQIKDFNDYLPYGEYGIHNIYLIETYERSNDNIILDEQELRKTNE